MGLGPGDKTLSITTRIQSGHSRYSVSVELCFCLFLFGCVPIVRFVVAVTTASGNNKLFTSLLCVCFCVIQESLYKCMFLWLHLMVSCDHQLWLSYIPHLPLSPPSSLLDEYEPLCVCPCMIALVLSCPSFHLSTLPLLMFPPFRFYPLQHSLPLSFYPFPPFFLLNQSHCPQRVLSDV